jgi:AraC-like DNA-binding protein
MYRERASRLAGAVLWQDTVPAAGSVQRVLPDGCMDLIWNDGALLVAGPDTRAHLEVSPPGASFVALRFAPGTGPAVVGVRAHELRDQLVPLADIWPSAHVRRVTAYLDEAPDRATALETVAAGRLRQTYPPDPMIAAIVARLRASMTVVDTANAVGLGERQLHRRCLVAFGYGPKTLANILRMNRAVAMSRAGMPFATVAAAAGYADQSHLAREVKALAGVPLGALMP